MNSKTLIERLFRWKQVFSGFSATCGVYVGRACGGRYGGSSILISVPKKRFKRAVKRNLVKRQVVRTYRKNKHLLLGCASFPEQKTDYRLYMVDNHIHSSAEVEEKVKKLLFHIVERLE